MISEQNVKDFLRTGSYIADDAIATAVFLALRMEKPILIEGPPGVGKTGLAKALSSALDFPMVRLQCYEGIDEGKALYDWEYGKQLLYTQLLRTQLDNYLSVSADLREAVERLSAEESLFFSENFLVQRPILRSFMSEKRSLLLIDEIDRSDDEFEALLLECLSDFQVSIPELGVIEANLAQQMVQFLRKVRELNLRKPPSVSETLDWAQVLSILKATKLTAEVVANTVGVIAKHQTDLQKVTELAAQELR